MIFGKRGTRVLGILYLIIGAVFMLNGSGITGFAISEGLGVARGFLFYLGIVFAGIGVFVLSINIRERGAESPLVNYANQVPKPINIRGFQPAGGSEKSARAAARSETGQVNNPYTKAPWYMGVDGLLYSLDRRHYNSVVNRGLSPEQIAKEIHFDVTDPRTLRKDHEVGLDGQVITKKNK